MSVSRANLIDKTSVYISAGLISACGALMFNVLPVFIGALAEEFAFSESQLGDVIASFNVAFTLAAVSALVWVRKVNWQIASIVGLVISIASFIAMTGSADYAFILSLTASVGLGMGMLYALVMAILGDSDNPDKAFGLKLGLETVPGAICLFVLPALVYPSFGFEGVVLCLACLLFLLGLSTFWLPTRGEKSFDTKSVAIDSSALKRNSQYTSKSKNNLLSGLALFSSLAFFTGIIASWGFLELLADSKELSSGEVGQVLSVGFVICGIGGFVAALIGDRWGRLKPFAFIVLINLMGLWQLASFNGLWGYAIGACLFLFSVNFTLAYTFGLTAQVDETGELVVLSAAVLSIGAIIGPFFSGRIVESMGFEGMLIFSATCVVIALFIYVIVIHLHQKWLSTTAG
jgi:MFS family permease